MQIQCSVLSMHIALKLPWAGWLESLKILDGDLRSTPIILPLLVHTTKFCSWPENGLNHLLKLCVAFKLIFTLNMIIYVFLLSLFLLLLRQYISFT